MSIRDAIGEVVSVLVLPRGKKGLGTLGKAYEGPLRCFFYIHTYEVGDKRNEQCCNCATTTIDYRDDK